MLASQASYFAQRFSHYSSVISLTSVSTDLYLAGASNAEISEDTEAEVPGTSNTAVSTASNAEISEETEAKVPIVADTDISGPAYGRISEESEAKVSIVANTDISWPSY